MNSIFKYITLGFEVFNAVTTIIAMVKVPALLNADLVWGAVRPVLSEIADVAHVSINMTVAQKITGDAVQTIKDALHKGA